MSLYIVLGSPRSGTSLIAGLLHYNQVDMGKFNLPEHPPSGEKLISDPNPFGYFEDVEFSQRNDAIINGTQIGTYSSPPPISDLQDYFNVPVLEEIGARIRNRHEFMGDRDWGFKDPRTILVWMHYDGHLKDAMHPKIIATFRNPMHAGRSFRQMGMGSTMGQAIGAVAEYQKRLADILRSTPWPYLTLSFEDWWYRPDTNKDKMSTFLGRGLDYSHLKPELWRQ